ncbi:MAG TPA: DUF6526 family protein [Thermoanaerobaculia bacterium]|nr:DUF6526 family protein [Thermoanaerobaculia bacterium]
MADPARQSYANHFRLVPPYHIVLSLILLVNFFYCLVRAIVAFSWPTLLAALMGLAFLLMFLYMRTFPLKVQDRLIRLEMRLRLERILPADLKARIPELTVSQLIALRFASDAEMPSLVREVLDQKITRQKDIKQKVRDWQADHLRA